ncbi:MAG TPA: MlaD family protein, partial [Pseudomonadota bacterium]|jgi:phospholipid/cholesterol/gamma-HCH transport system substrate-binding protein|nr:MlaD family protein [Pseudomonadota bacterium]HNN52627.1 MlaD family protein [Pseudomonadota bacterium]
MKTVSAALKVGLTTLAILALSAVAYRFVAKGVRGQEGPVVWALFRDATGLVDKSRVQIAGLIIGEIAERRLQGTYARVSIRLRPDVELWSNAVIYKKSSSLLGEFFIEIDPGTPQSPDPLSGQLVKNSPIKNGDQLINVVEAVTTGDILYQVNETLPIVRDILRDVQRLTQGPVQDIAREVKDSVAQNSMAISELLRHVDGIAQDVRGITAGPSAKDVQISIANIREVTEGLRDLVGKGSSEVDSTGTKLRQNLDKLSQAVDSLNSALGNVDRITGDVRKGKGTVGRLLVDDAIANNVEQITQDASELVGGINRLQTVVGLRSEYYIQANDFKNAIEVRLQMRPDKYYQIELIDDPRMSRTFTRQITTTDDPSKPLTTTTDLVTLTRAFKVSFQFAKRLFLDPKWFILTLRYGIKESTGGIGLDVDLLKERWTFKIDAFDFRTNIWPRLRIYSTVQFYRNMFLLAGVDDVINSRPPGGQGSFGRDYYVGAQLMFNDEDLKSLLAVGGSAMGNALK